MNLFGVGPLELLFLFLIILLVFKPEDIGKIARSAGRTLNRLLKSDEWRMVSKTARDLRDLPSRLMREAELEELKNIKRDLEETSQALQRESKDLGSRLSDIERSIYNDNMAKQPGTHPGHPENDSQPGKVKGQEAHTADSSEQDSSRK
jgi:Sec-independent protein translocase protein TatA